MLKNDIRYVIKKIIIGIGICIGLFYFKSCNVYALNDQWYDLGSSNTSISGQCINNNQQIDYVIDGKLYRLKNTNGSIYLNDTFVTNVTTCPGYIIGKDINNKVVAYFRVGSNNYNYYFITFYTNWGSVPNFTEFPFRINNLAQGPTAKKMVYNNGVLESNTSINCPTTIIHNSEANVCFNNQDFYVYGTNILKFFYNSNFYEKYFYSNYGSPVIIPPTESKIVSLNPQPILSDDDTILLGYNFTLEFDNFDTTNFVYKYKIGTGRTLIFTTNNYQLSLRNNDTLYVWSEDLEGNVIDSETFTVTNIGGLYSGQYSIDFTYKDIAPSDTENSTGLSNIIDRVDIGITYLPKTNKLKYQYQYVNSGGSLDPQIWVQLNDNNSLNEYTFVAHDNGTLYARILDENNNVLATNTFSVDSIGKIKLFKDNNNIGGIFNSVTNNINYSGPIYSLILMPINFINTIYNNSSNTCQRYKIGTLLNNDIYFECVDFSDYIGSDLYHLIDILCASGVIYGIALFIKRKYNQFTSLSDNENDIM